MGRSGGTNAYYDSAYIDTGIFVLYEDAAHLLKIIFK